jgi:dihydroxyacetone kinase-like predicted kinase
VAGVGFYEPRFQGLRLSNFKINEVIGYLMLMVAFLMVASFAYSLVTGDHEGTILSLLPVTAFLAVYINWISKKFLLNT